MRKFLLVLSLVFLFACSTSVVEDVENVEAIDSTELAVDTNSAIVVDSVLNINE